MPPLSRRQLLRRLAALALGAIGGSALGACTPGAAPAQPSPNDTVAASPTPEAVPPTATPVPSVTPAAAAPSGRPEIIRFRPDVPSTVVHARHTGVWDGESLSPAAVRAMLDASITELTGLGDARAAWAALFRPEERVAIKVNVFRNSLVWTHLPLVTALTDCLQEAGLPPEQIVIFDYLTSEFETAGYPVNQDGPGVRCYGTDQRYTEGRDVAGKSIKLSDVLLECDALINLPVLKKHMMSGLSFALKNHYGTVDLPERLHSPLSRCIAELNTLPEIKDRTRLVIGDALGVCIQDVASWPYWREEKPGDSLLVSYDPVAVDTLGLRLFSEMLTANGGDPAWPQDKANEYLEIAAELGVGTNDEGNMDVRELALT
jgi:hypothetical protein